MRSSFERTPRRPFAGPARKAPDGARVALGIGMGAMRWTRASGGGGFSRRLATRA